MRRKFFIILFLVIPALVFVLGGMWFFKSLNARKGQAPTTNQSTPRK